MFPFLSLIASKISCYYIILKYKPSAKKQVFSNVVFSIKCFTDWSLFLQCIRDSESIRVKVGRWFSKSVIHMVCDSVGSFKWSSSNASPWQIKVWFPIQESFQQEWPTQQRPSPNVFRSHQTTDDWFWLADTLGTELLCQWWLGRIRLAKTRLPV